MHLTFAQASLIAQHIEAGTAAHKTAVTVAVCDAAGDLVLLHRTDGAPGFSSELAAAKAYTAARFGNATAALEDLWSERPVYAHSLVAQGKWFVGRGGVPVLIDGTVVGAIGVSGADPEEEERLAIEAAEMITSDRS